MILNDLGAPQSSTSGAVFVTVSTPSSTLPDKKCFFLPLHLISPTTFQGWTVSFRGVSLFQFFFGGGMLRRGSKRFGAWGMPGMPIFRRFLLVSRVRVTQLTHHLNYVSNMNFSAHTGPHPGTIFFDVPAATKSRPPSLAAGWIVKIPSMDITTISIVTTNPMDPRHAQKKKLKCRYPHSTYWNGLERCVERVEFVRFFLECNFEKSLRGTATL